MQRAHTREIAVSCATLAELFEARAAQAPDALAYAFVHDDLRLSAAWTAAALAAKARSLASVLCKQTQAGESVLLVYPAGLEFVRAFWACVLAGLVPVPVSTLDAARLRSGLARLRTIGADAKARLVLCDENTLALVHAEDAPAAHEQWLATDTAGGDEHFQTRSDAKADALAYLQYTSGSTSAPRGVMVTHASALANCAGLSAAQQPDEATKVLSWLPHFHDYGLVHGIVWPLFAGVPAHLMSPITFLRRPLRWLEAIAHLGISHSGAPHFAYAACLDALDANPDWYADLGTWQHASCGAEPIQAHTARAFAARFAPHGLSERAFTPAYGLAEATLLVSVKRYNDVFATVRVDAVALERGTVRLVDESAAQSRELVCCGSPIEGLAVRVVDAETRCDCGPLTVGEIWVEGSSVGAGYMGRSADGEGVFRQALANDAPARWLRSGDLGFQHDGQVVITGRLKDLLIVNGRNVYPQDVEFTAQQAVEGLRSGYSAAFSVDSASGEQAVIMLEVERRAQAGDLGAMAAAIRHAVALEHELPVQAVVLLKAGTIARTSSGKIQRSRCRTDYLEGRLAPLWVDAIGSTQRSASSGEGAGGVLQELLQTIGRLLDRPAPAADPQRSAVENGLDSLGAFRLLDSIEARFGITLSPSLVLGAEPLVQLARHIEAVQSSMQRDGASTGEALRATDEHFALSWQQQGVWFADRIGGNGLYNLVQATRIRGPVDVVRLQSTLATLIDRHEALRLAVIERDGAPLQWVQRETAAPWHRVDLTTVPPERREPELRQRLDRLAREPFDLSRAPLLHATLFHLAAQECVVALALHHLVFDGWSAALLMREWAGLYAGAAAAPPPRGYSHFVSWQRSFLATRSSQAALQALRRQVAGIPNLELPCDRPRSPQPTFAGALHRFVLNAERVRNLREVAARHNVTLFMLLMGAFQALMSRLSGQQEFGVGTPASARPHRDLEQTVGLFTNTLVLRADVAGNPTFAELLGRVRHHALMAYEHQLIPFDLVASESRAQRELGRNLLFQVGLALQSMGDTRLHLPGLECQELPVHTGTARTDLWLAFTQIDGQLQAELEYATDLFDEPTARRISEAFVQLLECAVARPETPVSSLPLLNEADRQQILHGWNDTARDYPLQWCMHELIEQQVARCPQREAVRLGDGTLTFRELDQRANRLAQHLRSLGVGRDVLVGVCMQRSLELPVAMLAVLKAGGAYVPLDPDLPAARLEFMLQDAATPVLITHSALLERITAATQTQRPAVLALDTLEPQLADRPASAPSAVAGPDDTAYVIYTSGSTGQPKGVPVIHRAMCNHKHWEVECLGLNDTHRTLQKTTISFDASIFELFTPLQVGATVVLAQPGEHRDTRYLVRTVRDERITHLVLTPSAARALLAEPELSACSGLQHLLLGGESLDYELVHALRSRLPHLRIGNFYGPSETTEDATHHEVAFTAPATGPVPIGRPVANMRCHVLDAAMQPVPVGVSGELYIGGLGVSRGYLHRPALTAERFVADPFHAGERLYRTGDLARYRADGELVFLGRADAQVKIRGFRIEPGEVEATLKRCTGVRDAAVIAQLAASGDADLVAYVAGENLQTASLRHQLGQWLPDFMMPSAWVMLDRLPTLPNGKLDRRALPPASLFSASTADGAGAPRGEVERAVHDIWRQLLRADAIGVHDNFFELGGHSLVATQLVARVRSLLRADLPLRTVFERPTISGLAQAIEAVWARSGRIEPEAPILAVARDRPLPLSFSQQRMWLVQQMDPQGTAYNMPFASRIKGRVDAQVLRRAVTLMVDRHEAFRTRFHIEQGTPVQSIERAVDTPFTTVDVGHIAPQAREAHVRELLRREALTPFDLSHAPLLRVTLIGLSDNDHVLLFLVHHAVGDQWSGGVLARELTAVYRSLIAGTDVPLEPLRIQYADYAAWQRGHPAAHALDRERAHWRQRLTGAATLQLPCDAAAPSRAGSPGASIIHPLDRAAAEGVRNLASARAATPFMVYLAVFNLLLARYCGQTDIVVGTPIANRTRADTEDLVGTMVNTLVMRTDVSGDPSFAELLDRVKETALLAYAHQHLPYEQLVEDLRPAGGAPSPAAVRVLFNLPNAPWQPPVLPGASVEPFEFDRGSAQFDLSLSVDAEHFHRLHVEYSSAAFRGETAAQMVAHYHHLLLQAVAQPDLPISRLSVLTDAERAQLRRDAGHSQRALPSEPQIDRLISAQAARRPAALAVTQGIFTQDYADLERQSNQLAHHLRRLGVSRGSLVGVCLERTPVMVVALLAVMKSGAAYVPLDPAFPRDRLRFMVEDSGLTLVITHGAVHGAPVPSHGHLLDLDALSAAIAEEPDEAPASLAAADDLAYVLYTSGSTGRPKGVEITHRSLLNFIASMQLEPGCSDQDRLLAVTTLSFDISALELYLPLSVGASVELATRDEVIDPRALIERMQAFRPTIMQATPATWRMLIEAGWTGDAQLTVLCGGEPLPGELAAQLLERCARLWNLYGPTETTVWSTLERVRPDEAVTIGRPIANTAVHVLDASLQPVPVGVTGELFIGGLGVARGYRGRPELTAERFIPDPFAGDAQQRLYRTGDLARRLADGRFVHLGRNDFQVKVRGFRIELGEIESVLSRHPSVAHCAIAAKLDRSGIQQLVAYVVQRDRAAFNAGALREHLQQSLPAYMVPTYFMSLPALPLTDNRKVDVQALPEPNAADAPALARPEADPQGLLAVQLLALWRQVLEDDSLGMHDNFFERGGHSLKAVQLLMMVERVFGRRLPLATLIDAPTVAQLEQAVTRADWAVPWRSLVALAVHGTRTPVHLVPGVGGNVLSFTMLAKLFDGERPVYGLQTPGLDGVAQPLRSVSALAEHHVREIRSVQPHGPYVIGGACTGGVVAYEIARQLEQQHERVELVIMESWHPSSYRLPGGRQHLAQTLRFAINRARAVLRTLAALPPWRWPSVLRRAWFNARLVDGALEESLAGNDYLSDRVVAATFEAVATYDARPFGGRLLNVIATARPLAGGTVDTRREWEALARGGAHSAGLAAEDSGRLLVAPHVEPLADLMRRHLGNDL